MRFVFLIKFNLINKIKKILLIFFRANLNNLTYNFIITLPRLEFKGKYSLKMKLLVFDIAGKGDMNGTFINTKSRVEMRANKVERDGAQFLKFEKFKIKMQIGKREFNLANLFNGKNFEKKKYFNFYGKL